MRSRGLGDSIAKFAKKTGIKAAVQILLAVLINPVVVNKDKII